MYQFHFQLTSLSLPIIKMLGCNNMTGASSSVGMSTHSSTNISAMTGTGVEYLEMSAAGSSTRLQTSDTLKTLDATQLPKG